MVSKTGNDGKQIGKARIGIVSTGPRATDRRCHQNRTGENRTGFVGQLVRWQVRIVLDSLEQRTERDLVNDKASVETVFRDRVLVPLAKVMIGPAVDRMIKIKRARVQCEDAETFEIKTSGSKNVWIGRGDRFDCDINDFAKRAFRRAGSGHVKGNGAGPLVRIRFGFVSLQGCDRAVADKVVKRCDHAGGI